MLVFTCWYSQLIGSHADTHHPLTQARTSRAPLCTLLGITFDIVRQYCVHVQSLLSTLLGKDQPRMRQLVTLMRLFRTLMSFFITFITGKDQPRMRQFIYLSAPPPTKHTLDVVATLRHVTIRTRDHTYT